MRPEGIEKRKRIMRRSMALGHCVCDPQKPCPCPLFREQNVCECAGERLPAREGEVRLTEHVRSAGCASKIGKNDLAAVLEGLPEIDDPRVVVGRAAGDDAGVILLSKKTATILTVDVFAPSVDDPYTFGQVAAANSVSDIYAMGGTPQSALSIVGYPIHSLPPGAMHEILRGGVEKMAAAGVSVIGGHSINDAEIKCGFAVLGTAPADQLRHERGRAGGRCDRADQAPGRGHRRLRPADRAGVARRHGPGGRIHVRAQPARKRADARAPRARGDRRDRVQPARPHGRNCPQQPRRGRARL